MKQKNQIFSAIHGSIILKYDKAEDVIKKIERLISSLNSDAIRDQINTPDPSGVNSLVMVVNCLKADMCFEILEFLRSHGGDYNIVVGRFTILGRVIDKLSHPRSQEFKIRQEYKALAESLISKGAKLNENEAINLLFKASHIGCNDMLVSHLKYYSMCNGAGSLRDFINQPEPFGKKDQTALDKALFKAAETKINVCQNQEMLAKYMEIVTLLVAAGGVSIYNAEEDNITSVPVANERKIILKEAEDEAQLINSAGGLQRVLDVLYNNSINPVDFSILIRQLNAASGASEQEESIGAAASAHAPSDHNDPKLHLADLGELKEEDSKDASASAASASMPELREVNNDQDGATSAPASSMPESREVDHDLQPLGEIPGDLI